MRMWAAFDFEKRRMAFVVFRTVTTCALVCAVGTGTAVAQTSYPNLDAAVNELTARLMSGGGLSGQQVLVTPNDFFEGGTNRNLPLSATLSERFSSKLSEQGVNVALSGADEREVKVLQGIWQVMPGAAGNLGGTRTLRLSVKLIELGEGAHPRTVHSAGGTIEEVSEELLVPDLRSWGRFVVKDLERRSSEHSRRFIHIGDIRIPQNVPDRDGLRSYLVEHWLNPVFATSRLFRLVSAERGLSQGVLKASVVLASEQVQVAFQVLDNEGRQVSATSVSPSRALFPDGMLGPPRDPRGILAFESGEVDLSKDNFPLMNGTGIRGFIPGTIDFEAPFQQSPKVVVALSALDVEKGRNLRIRVVVKEIRQDAFDFEFFTWAATQVHWARMSWFAYGYR